MLTNLQHHPHADPEALEDSTQLLRFTCMPPEQLLPPDMERPEGLLTVPVQVGARYSDMQAHYKGA